MMGESSKTSAGAVSILFYLMIAVVVAGITWAVFAEIDQVVRAEAVVEPASKVQGVEARYAGKLLTVAVAVGQSVEAGDLLFQLDQADALAEAAQNSLVIAAAEAEVARLEAESRGAQALLIDPVLSTPALRAEQEALFVARQSDLRAQLEVLSQQARRIESSMVESEAVIASAGERLALLEEEIALYEPLVAQGIEPRIRLLELRQKTQQTRDAARQAELAIAGAEIEWAELGTKREQLLRGFEAEAGQQLAERRQTLARARAQAEALAERVQATRLLAPVSGVVTAVYPAGAGEVVAAGDRLAEIVPASESLRIRARILPKDISKVSVGQPARVSLTAYDFAKYGVIEGALITIAQNTTETEQGETFYEAWVESSSSTFSKSEVRPNILPGMQAQVDILGEKRTVMAYILAPILRTSSRALTEQ